MPFPTPVPFLDLSRQHRALYNELYEVTKDVILSGNFIKGKQVEGFEREFAKYCHTNFAVGVSSGTDALVLSLMAAGIGPHDEVITTPYTFVATASAIARVGATPVFVDIEPDSYNIDPTKIEAAITGRTRAIIPVHLFGNPCNMTAINTIAQTHRLFVIEDACQAVGSKRYGHPVGGLGDMGCFSFFPSKNLGGCGDGGMITTNSSILYEKLLVLREHGSVKKYEHKFLSGNYRLDALQAAILRVKLPFMNSFVMRRIMIADRYHTSLFLGKELICKPFHSPDEFHGYNQYVINTMALPISQQWSAITGIKQALTDAKIGFMVYYPKPLHLQECFSYLKLSEGMFPVSESLAKNSVALPIYPELTGEEQIAVMAAINSAIV